MRLAATRTLTGVLAAALVVAACEEAKIMQPDAQAPVIENPEAVVAALAYAYRQRDPELLASLLANDPDNNAAYAFLSSEPGAAGPVQWEHTQEARIHRRMLRPDQVPAGDTPVPAESWIRILSIQLTPLESFSERPDLYSKDGGADGLLDPELWRATDASYNADLFLDLAGDTDYAIRSVQYFLVIENRRKAVGEPGKFLLLLWEEPGSPTTRITEVQRATWTGIKLLYK